MILYYIFAGLVSVFLWEHIARLYNIKIRPSPLLSFLSINAQKLFSKIGTLLARLSSFYTYINLEEIKKTLSDLLVPVFDIFTSPVHTLIGYMNTLSKYKYKILIPLGSVTLLGILYCAYLRFVNPDFTLTSLLPTLYLPRP